MQEIAAILGLKERTQGWNKGLGGGILESMAETQISGIYSQGPIPFRFNLSLCILMFIFFFFWKTFIVIFFPFSFSGAYC